MYLTMASFMKLYVAVYDVKGVDGMDIMMLVSEGIIDFVEAIIILLLFISLMHKKDFIKTDKVRTVIFVIIFTIFAFWATIYLPFGFHTICIASFLMIALSLITRSNIISSSISVMVIILMFCITEICILMIGMLIFNFNFVDVIHNLTYKIYFSAIVKTIQLIIALYFYRMKVKLFNHNIYKKSNTILSFVILQMFMMAVFILSLNYVSSTQRNISIYNFLLYAIYFMFVFFAYIDYKEREKIINLQNKFMLQEEYVKNIEETINLIRREKYEFNNHLNTIFALSTMNKPNSHKKIQSYIRRLNEEINVSDVFYHTGNDYIDGLLAVRAGYAYKHNIHLDVDIEAPLFEVKVNDSHLISIIAHIIDNAYEAIKRINKKEKAVVSICTYIENGKYYLSIANNGPKIAEQNLSRIFEGGYTSKKVSPMKHGYGLYIVKTLVTRNDGKITVKSSEEETEFLIEFNINSSIKMEKPKDVQHLKVVK